VEIVVVILLGIPAVLLLGAFVYTALFQREQIAFYRKTFADRPMGNPSEWSRYIGSGERW